jgi:glycosyltransferase involved in cell wall biosynthesis
MPVIPNSGGINLEEIPKDSLPPSQRKKIIIKGYTGFVGQALVALKACELAADHLKGYEVVIYSASLKTRIRALKLQHFHKIRVTILKKRIPHLEMLKHFSEARVYIGISLSDGISTSLLEAMATGCYPIQTNTSCADEWISGNSGSIVDSISIQSVTDAIIHALISDIRVDHAQLINTQKIMNTASCDSVASSARDFYSLAI